MVLTSPPYYGIEVYSGTPKRTKSRWNDLYKTVFWNAYTIMSDGGVHKRQRRNMSVVCNPSLGEACDKRFIHK
jgi:hypothetical protein